MEILTLAGFACLAVWFAVAIRQGWLGAASPLSIPLAAAAVVLVGSVWGPYFWSLEVGPLPLSLDRLLFAVVLVDLAVRVTQRRLAARRLTALDACVLAVMAVLTVSTMTHDWGYHDRLPLSRLVWLNGLPFGLYWLARIGPIPRRQRLVIVWGIAVFGLYLAATAVAEVRAVGSPWSFLATSPRTPSRSFSGAGAGRFSIPWRAACSRLSAASRCGVYGRRAAAQAVRRLASERSCWRRESFPRIRGASGWRRCWCGVADSRAARRCGRRGGW